MYYRKNPDEQIVQLLKELLATTYLVYIQTQGAHWNVVGSGFPQLHDLFENQYEELRDAVDEIAEHIRTYDVMSPASAKEFLDIASNLTEGQYREIDFRELAYDGAVDASYLIKALIVNHTAVTDICRSIVRHAGEEQPQTNELAAGRIAAHNKMLWMLKSTNKQTVRELSDHQALGTRRMRRWRRNPWRARNPFEGPHRHIRERMEHGMGVSKSLKQWSEEPRTLLEDFAMRNVETGSDPEGERDFSWAGATKEPFLSLEADGWIKREYVMRTNDGYIVTVHFWESLGGEREYIKVKSSWKKPETKQRYH